jgi:hypothetical protein
MTIEQTVEIPENHRLSIQVPPEVPVGRARIVFFPAPNVESQSEELPRITRAQWAKWEKNPDPVIERMSELADQMNFSWFPEGLTRENITMKDIRALRIKEKYNV